MKGNYPYKRSSAVGVQLICSIHSGIYKQTFSLSKLTKMRTLFTQKKSLCMFLSHVPPQFVKCGFAGSNFPNHIFPAMVGRPIIRSSTKVGNIEIKVRLVSNEQAACSLLFHRTWQMKSVCLHVGCDHGGLNRIKHENPTNSSPFYVLLCIM